MHRAKGFELGGQHMQANAVNGADMKASDHLVRQRADATVNRVIDLQHLARRLLEDAPLRSHGEFFLTPLEEAHAVPFLQGADLLADGTLGDAIFFRGLGEAAKLDQVAKNLQSQELHEWSGEWNECGNRNRPMALIHDNIENVKSKIAAALAQAGRQDCDVELLAVSKTFPVEIIREAVNAGLRMFGENKVQEILSKQPLLPANLRWHLIGHLQSNKIRKILPAVDVIQSVDSLALAQDINRIAAELGLFPKVYLEVNVAAEASKFGFAPTALESQIEDLFKLDRLEIQGLMCIPPPAPDAEGARPYFVFLREFRDRLEQLTGTPFPALSMGMSHDYVVAIQEGATVVRVGSAIFGGR